MTAPRLFLPPGTRLPGSGEALALPEAQRHYLGRVLRLAAGRRVTLLDGVACADAVLLEDGRLEVQRTWPAQQAPRRTMLLLGLLKGDKMDWVVQKATELGATDLVPVALRRSVRRPAADPARAGRQGERWRRIATAAAQQARRDDVPQVTGVMDLDEALRLAGATALRLVLWEGALSRPLRDELPPERPQSLAVLVGPEGGLEAAEVAAAEVAGFRVCGLGPRVLRAETAALAVLASLDAIWPPAI